MVGATAENDDKEDDVSESLFCFKKKEKIMRHGIFLGERTRKGTEGQWRSECV